MIRLRWWVLWLGLVAAVVAVIALTEGGSSNEPVTEASAEPQHSTPVEATTTEGPPPEEVGGPLSYVGTITGSGEGTTFSDDLRLGRIVYSKEGTPPEAVLNACNINNSTLLASSVFARGKVAISYQEGSLPTAIAINSWEELVQGKLYGVVALRINGEWQCRNEEGVSLEFQPGESQTLPIWVIAVQVLSNAQPRVPASVFNTWYFNFIGQYVSEQGSLVVRGPGAGLCKEEFSEEERLLLYNRSGSC